MNSIICLEKSWWR